MKAPAPSTVSARIASYPEVVKSGLCSKVTEFDIQEAIALLHGQPGLPRGKLDALLQAPPLRDAFLTRLMRSNRFYSHLDHFMTALDRGDFAVVLQFLQEIVPIFADPDKPYIYKLQEAQAEHQEKSAREAPVLSFFLDMLQQYQRLSPELFAPEQIVQNEMLLFASGAQAPLFSCLLKALGCPVRCQNLSPFLSEPFWARGYVFCAALLQHFQIARLPESEIGLLQQIATCCASADGTLPLSPPRLLHVVGPEKERAAARRKWGTLYAKGLLTEEDTQGARHLELTTTDLLPRLLAVCLLCLPKESATQLEVVHAPGAPAGTWDKRMIGYPQQPPPQVIARLQTATGSQVKVPATQSVHCTGGGAAPRKPRPALEDAFAILLQTDQNIDPDRYWNADKCVIVDSLAQLQQICATANLSVLQKPVVGLGKFSPDTPDYLVNLVQTYWAHGGRYPVTPFRLAYDGQRGHYSVSVVHSTQPVLSHIAAWDGLVLPLQLLSDMPAEHHALCAAGLYLRRPGVIVNCPLEPSLALQNVAVQLHRYFNGLSLSVTETEALYLGSAFDESALEAAPVIFDWPIAAIMRRINTENRQLQTRISTFLQNPTAEGANSILDMLEAEKTSRRWQEYGPAVLEKLAAQCDILLSLEPKRVVAALQHALLLPAPARQSITQHLYPHCQSILRAHHSYVVPLFDLFSCAFSCTAVQAGFVFAMVDPRLPPRTHIKLLHCLQRYGFVDLLLQYASFLQLNRSDLLMHKDVQQVIRSVLPQNTGATCPEEVHKGQATPSPQERLFATRFLSALLKTDKNRLMQLLEDIEQFGPADYLVWLDGLRCYSNELRQMGLSTSSTAISQPSNLYAHKLMGAVFSDRPVLSALNDGGFLEEDNDLNALCKGILQDNTLLNQRIARLSNAAGVAPLALQGTSVAEVFHNAQTNTPFPPKPEAQPRVSVIISALGANSETLSFALAALFAQSHNDIEVFILYDCARPDIAAQCANLMISRQHIELIPVHPAEGEFLGRNAAIKGSTGNFIAFVQPSDWMHPEWIALNLETLLKTEALRAVATSRIRIDMAGRVQMAAGFKITESGVDGAMYRREVFEQIGYFASTLELGDAEIWARVQAYYGMHSVASLPVPMTLRRAGLVPAESAPPDHKAYARAQYQKLIQERPSLLAARQKERKLEAADLLPIPVPLRAEQMR